MATGHCQECLPHDVPPGTTVVCSHTEHSHEHAGSAKRGSKSNPTHVIIAAGPPNPLDPIVGILRDLAGGE